MTGQQTASFTSQFIPSFAGTTVLTTLAGTMWAYPLPLAVDGGSPLSWKFYTPGETVLIAPIVVGPHVVVGTSKRVVVLSPADGSVVSSAPLTGIPTPNEAIDTELPGLAAADGMLFVLSGTLIVAY